MGNRAAPALLENQRLRMWEGKLCNESSASYAVTNKLKHMGIEQGTTLTVTV